MSNLTGKALDRYHILEQLGEGGMATVYKAYDTRLQADVALKVIRSEVIAKDATGKSIKRFEREARALAKLDHPNIVKVTDYGEHEGSPYLVMPLLSGGTLKKRLGRPLVWNEAAALLLPIARALAYAHQQGIIHRDVKPSNILITESGDPMLSDFGVAKLLETEETLELTGTGIGVGTPEYMAPEQGMGQRVDHRTDIYALGVIFYEMVTGRKPYRADTPMAVLYKQMTDPLPRPSQFAPGLPQDVERVLFKALTKTPDERYQSMQELATALDSLLRGTKKAEAPIQKRQPRKDSAPRPRSTLVAPRLVLTFVLVTVVVGLVIGFGPLLLTRFTANPSALPIEATKTPGAAPVDPASITSTPASISLPAEIRDEQGITMVLVSEGDFIMGLTPEQAAENCRLRGTECNPDWFTGPGDVHTIFLDSFYIDKFEVTNANYRDCVENGVCDPPKEANSATHEFYYAPDSAYDNYPVINVDWNMADTFCRWRGALLPTEAQWEKAARGTDGRIYPSGNSMDPTYANILGRVGDTVEVGSYEKGQSPYGVFDMSGNVREWVADWYSEDYYPAAPASNPTGPDSGENRVQKGDAWNFEPTKGYQSIGGHGNAHPLSYDNATGFRCARLADTTATAIPSTSALPSLAAADGGGPLYFVSDRGNRWNLYQIDPATGDSNPVLPENLALEKPDGYYSFIHSWSPDRQRLLFGLYSSGTMASIYVFSNGEATLLSDYPEDSWWGAAWSPDSKVIAFSSKQFTQHTSITTINVETLERNTLTIGESPSWSLDGTKILYSSGTYYREDVRPMLFDIRDSSLKIVTENGWWPQWSPDGNHIAYYKGGQQNRTIHVSDAQGKYVAQIASGVDNDFVWAPDGGQFAFLKNGDLYIADVTGSGETLLMDMPDDPDEYYDGQIVWSSDGQRIAVTITDWIKQEDEWVTKRSLNILNLATRDVVNLGDGQTPVFSPDSSMIAFVTERDGNSEIYVVNVDGTALQNMTNNPAAETQPSWIR